MSQEEIMFADQCILVDQDDKILGSISKYDAHRCIPESSIPLHRAFSVFLFDENKKLLLQQRAQDKITFPRVWSNTCCSHPLYGSNPTEVDQDKDVNLGQVPGIIRAAQRKLGHELGIDIDFIPAENFKYLTRIQYYAKDEITYGTEAPWGEHEIDYILFVQSTSQLKLLPNKVTS